MLKKGYISGIGINYAGTLPKVKKADITEVIKYSTLLERAQLRNKIFIDKLTKLA